MKRWLLPLIAVLVIAVVLSGCAQTAPSPAPAKTPAPAATTQWMRIFGGSVGSTMNFKQELIAQIFRKTHPEWNVRVVSGLTGASGWALMYNRGLEIDTESMLELIDASTKGTMGGVKVPQMPGKFIYATDVYTIHLVLLESVPINSFDELIQKKYPIKLSVGRPGTAPRSLPDLAFKEIYGITIQDMESWGSKLLAGSGADAANQISDGLSEGFLTAGGIPQIPIEEISTKQKMKLVTLSDPKAIEKLAKVGFSPITVKAKGYSFVTKDMQSVGVPQISMIRADMSDKLVTDIAKAVWEERKFLQQNYDGFGDYLSPEYVKILLQTYGDWMHPAAKKYFSEQGIK